MSNIQTTRLVFEHLPYRVYTVLLLFIYLYDTSAPVEISCKDTV